MSPPALVYALKLNMAGSLFLIASSAIRDTWGAKKRLERTRSICGLSLEPVSKSFEENNEAGKLDKAEEIAGVVLPANEDPALPLNPGEEAFDEPASHVAA